MIMYYVVSESDPDFDLDACEHVYSSKEEALVNKKRLEEMSGEKYNIWEVD